jgi:thioredoxin-like negative regulator of GroEL
MSTFETLTDQLSLDTFIEQHDLSFLYISRPNCSVCVSLLPQIEEVMAEFPDVKPAYVSTETIPEVASQFNIFTVPVLILFVEGKEYLREARIVPVQPFKEKVQQIVEGYTS